MTLPATTAWLNFWPSRTPLRGQRTFFRRQRRAQKGQFLIERAHREIVLTTRGTFRRTPRPPR